MVLGRDLTIKEIDNQLKALKIKLFDLAIKYNRTVYIRAISYKDIITRGGKRDDIMLNKVIKREELQDEYDAVMQSYNEYRELEINKIREKIANNSVDYCIVYFRDELHWKWKDIAKVFNYSLRQCYRIYNNFKK